MAFKRRFKMRRRRRRLPETYTLRTCNECINVASEMTCTLPFTDLFELLSMQTPRNPVSDPTEVTNPSSKTITFDGMKFQTIFSHDPAETQSCIATPGPIVNATKVSFNLKIWEAIMLLPLGQGSTIAPAYLPNLTQGVFQIGDTADRVLWKRLTILPIYGVADPLRTNQLQLTSSQDFEGGGPVHVKTRCRIDDRHALYYVRTMVNDVVWGTTLGGGDCGNLDCDSCQNGAGSPGTCNVLPVVVDFWAKMFYHVRN
jgi:hypothetical protein